MIKSWRLALEEANKSPRTVEAYIGSAETLLRYLREHDLPLDTEGVEAAHIRACLKAELDRTSPVSAHKIYRGLNVFWKWVAAEGERAGESPMTNVEAPTVTKKVKPPLTEEEIAALLKVCSGSSFTDRRDTAIIRILIDGGVSSSLGVRMLRASMRVGRPPPRWWTEWAGRVPCRSRVLQGLVATKRRVTPRSQGHSRGT
ncbi:tyrosine-type recombinase/integrase [Microtetraspora malaysiensis]|uniref:tyrosine-type recombinase/integrase n=1 Tax=Microtetraspora malaysiensis TaxID=161358 RepID=UPI003D8FCBA4